MRGAGVSWVMDVCQLRMVASCWSLRPLHALTLSPFASASFAISCSRSSTVCSCCQLPFLMKAHPPLILLQLVALELEAGVSYHEVELAGWGACVEERVAEWKEEGEDGSARKVRRERSCNVQDESL